MNEQAFYRIQAWLLHEHGLLVSSQELEWVAADVNWDDTLDPAVVNLVSDESQPIPYMVTDAGRAKVKP